MFSICLFCKYPFTKLAIQKDYENEGVKVIEIRCPNCGAEYKNSTIIERGPTKQFNSNEPSKNKEKK